MGMLYRIGVTQFRAATGSPPAGPATCRRVARRVQPGGSISERLTNLHVTKPRPAAAAEASHTARPHTARPHSARSHTARSHTALHSSGIRRPGDNFQPGRPRSFVTWRFVRRSKTSLRRSAQWRRSTVALTVTPLPLPLPCPCPAPALRLPCPCPAPAAAPATIASSRLRKLCVALAQQHRDPKRTSSQDVCGPLELSGSGQAIVKGCNRALLTNHPS